MLSACGLDFGTSNTTLGAVEAGAPQLLPLEDGEVTIPSAIFFNQEGETSIGRAAVAAYVEGADGRLMRSIKSVLGTGLIEETTQLGRMRIGFRDVIQFFLAQVKERAELALGRPIDALVHGRPVHFVEGDAEGDARAEATLDAIAREIGYREVSFQFEPIAAALDYEQRIDREELALIADIGGGTSDFSIVRLGPARRARPDRTQDILANGGVRVGGTDFDRLVSLAEVMPLLGYRGRLKNKGLIVPAGYFHDLATWSAINRLYTPKLLRELADLRREVVDPEGIDRLIHVVREREGHRLAIEVEAGKIALSDVARVELQLPFIEAGLSAKLDREALISDTASLAGRIARCAAECIAMAGAPPEKIDALFLTGGSTRLAHVRSAIAALVPAARIVTGDTFGSVGSGLAIEAARRYG